MSFNVGCNKQLTLATRTIALQWITCKQYNHDKIDKMTAMIKDMHTKSVEDNVWHQRDIHFLNSVNVNI